MNNSLLIGGLIGVALWGFGVWKAAQLWSPPFLFDDPRKIKKQEKNGSIIPKLFWFSNGLLFIAAVTRMTLPKEMFRLIWMPTLILGEIGALALAIHMENTAKATRNLIRLSAVGYEGVLYWTPTFWVFEKPAQIFCAAFLFIVGGLLAFFIDEFRYLALFGLNLLILLLAICRYTALAVKKDRILIYRWLEVFPATKISHDDIISVQVDQPISHRIFGVLRLTIKTSGNNYFRVSLNDPSKAKKYIDEILDYSVSTKKTKVK